jgi:aspartyl protease family protein
MRCKRLPGKVQAKVEHTTGSMVGASMIRYAAIAVAGALSAVAAFQAVKGPEAHAAAEAPLRGAQDSAPPPAMLYKAADGHFWAEGLVNGAPVRFLVDTGASSVFLTVQDARRLGLDPLGLVYDQPVRTAAGDSRAARVRLDSVSVAGVRLTGVDALVIGEGLPASLLGMSYLGRLSRLEATPDVLVLDP